MGPVLEALDTLRYSLGSCPRVHPNGFIQLDLDAYKRLHVWHPKLPFRQKTYHPIHDHIFSFTSYCFSGRLVNVVYDIEPAPTTGTHEVWTAEARDGACTALVPTIDVPYALLPGGLDVMQPGDSYRFLARHFHETLSNEPTMTIMVKDSLSSLLGRKSPGPGIMVPIGVIPDNDFHREKDVNEDVLWELIREAHPCPLRASIFPPKR